MIGFQKYFLSQEVKISNVPADIYKKPVYNQTRMWADAQRNGRPAEYRWCPLQKFQRLRAYVSARYGHFELFLQLLAYLLGIEIIAVIS